MNHDTLKAAALLKKEGYTCVLCKDDIIYTSHQRGVRPLVEWLRTDKNLNGFSAADKVVGKATAFLYVMAGVKEVSAIVMSQTAMEVLARHGINYDSEETVPTIINRTGTGLCPMELAVLEIDTPTEAFAAIEQKLVSLQTAQSPQTTQF